MKFSNHGFETKEMVSILYWRICHEIIQAGFDLTSLLFACAIHCASRVVWSHGPIQRTAANAARATFLSRAAATGRADRLVPGRSGCADSRCFHLSGGDCRGGPLDAKSFQPQG